MYLIPKPGRSAVPAWVVNLAEVAASKLRYHFAGIARRLGRPGSEVIPPNFDAGNFGQITTQAGTRGLPVRESKYMF